MLNGLFNIGQSALNANQAWISVTGNNLANVETEGYSRQYVDQKDAGGLTYKPGAQPLGVNAQQIMRFFDQFLERSYVRQSTNSSRWDQQDTIMASLENIFNESNRQGVNSALNNFFNAWQDLALRPESTANRESLVSFSDSLSTMFTNTSNAIKAIQDEMNVSIRSDVNRVNEIAKSIADLNKQITSSTIDGMNNPNALLDKRDQLVRELSTLVDVETIDHGKGNFRVQLTTGQPLVDGNETYQLRVDAAKKENNLLAGSKYEGTINFDGTSTHEYTIEIVQGGDAKEYDADKIADAPSFRVSLDGGKTWLKDEDGKEMHYPITYTDGQVDADGNPKTDDVLVKDLRISFSSENGFEVGDRFVITPKEGLYWIEPTRGPQNITPQIGFDGQDNPNRVTGGKLAAYFAIRDDNCGRYQDELNAVANTLIWEVNRIHSQGAGLEKLSEVQGNQYVGRQDQPLGSDQAMTAFAHKMQNGNVNFHIYDKDGNYLDSSMLDFSKDGSGLNFDPEVHSLDAVVNAINSMTYRDKDGKLVVDDENKTVSPLKATIQDGKLFIETTDDNIQFAMGADTAGLMAGLGINSFFAGTNATDIAVDSQIHINTNLIAAGAVNGQFEVNPGDNITATAIGKLVDKTVKVTTMWKTVDNQTIGQYYANLVTTVGSDRRLSKTNTEYHTALTNDLFERTQAVTGVNMDEEMSNLIKYQHSYTAAAKLITTADQMLQTLLGLKQ